MTDWLSNIQTCINHVTLQSCEKIEKANKNILKICVQGEVLDREQLKAIYTNLRALDPQTKNQLNKMLEPIRTKCNPLLKVANELKTCVDAKVNDSKCAKETVNCPYGPQSCRVERKSLVTRDDLYLDCWNENETLKSMNVSQDEKFMIDNAFNKEFDPSKLQRREERCKRTEWSKDTLASLAKCHKHLEKQNCESWRSVGKEHPIMICGLDNVLGNKEFEKLYETIHYWGTEYRVPGKLKELDAFSFWSVTKDSNCKVWAMKELIRKGKPIVADTLDQNDWKKCEDNFLQLPCDQIIDPTDPTILMPGIFPPYRYCKDKGIITPEQYDNI